MNWFDIYHNIIFLAFIFTVLSITPNSQYSRVISVPNWKWSFVWGTLAIICFGSIPVVWHTWNDREAYALEILSYRTEGHTLNLSSSDIAFRYYCILSSKIFSYKGWFYLTAVIYVGNYLIAAKRLVKEYSLVLFVTILCCFQFYSYGTNTIRAGFAASFLLLGLTYINKYPVLIVCLLISLYSHFSMIIPISAFVISFFIKKNKLFIYLWLSCILVSYLYGKTIEHYFGGLVIDARTNYLSVNAAKTLYKVGFRWDFLLYSSLPVILGRYYIQTLKFRDAFYGLLYRTYLLANSFWILVIRANYTDRFAYLSWFLFPVLLVYPLLTQQLYRDVNDQRKNIVFVMTGIFGFCYFMYILSGGSFFGF